MKIYTSPSGVVYNSKSQLCFYTYRILVNSQCSDIAKGKILLLAVNRALAFFDFALKINDTTRGPHNEVILLSILGSYSFCYAWFVLFAECSTTYYYIYVQVGVSVCNPVCLQSQ